MSGGAFGATYRLQLSGAGFAVAAEAVPFLAALGVQTCYLSPVTRARDGSAHGYDVVDPTVLDPALGGRAHFDRLLDVLGEHGMTALLDIVPNHMAASPQSPFFADVLAHGRRSRDAAWFDIDWDCHDGRVMLPVLDRPLADALSAGSITVERDRGATYLGYGGQRYPVDPSTADTADPARLHDRQHYLLADWRLANAELNYRRFFDINDLIGLRQEDAGVFEATHRLVVELVADPRVAGVRVDHVDGLRDPAAYLRRLREALGEAAVIEVEKILESDEQLPSWPVDGTTGYEFAAALTGLFVDAAGAARLAAASAAATGDDRSFAERARAAKRAVIGSLFAHQLDRVVRQTLAALGQTAASPLADVRAAVAELTAQLAVYRTYRVAGEPIGIDDLRRVEAAAERARPLLASSQTVALDEVLAVLTGPLPPGGAAADAVAAWQQLTSPATAKGVEDTALYDPGRSLSLADVGSDPDRGTVTVAELHAWLAQRQQHMPRAMSTLSTHDSKRSHDVRCRLAVLTELPERWEAAVGRLEGSTAAADEVDAAERRYVYETLVGAWPLAGHDAASGDEFLARIGDYLTKSAREAKRRTSWVEPDEAHEAALRAFAADLLRGDPGRREVIEQVVDDIAAAGACNALASTVVRSLAPGVPDVYQNDDSWFLALVDPDNRRPLDVTAHRDLLTRLPALPDEPGLAELLARWRDGRIKQLLIRESLRLRRAQRGWLETADYVPLATSGRYAESVLAFARWTGDRLVACVVPCRPLTVAGPGRFPVGEAWADTAVTFPRAPLGELFTGRDVTTPSVPLAELFSPLPVAVLAAPPAATPGGR